MSETLNLINKIDYALLDVSSVVGLLAYKHKQINFNNNNNNNCITVECNLQYYTTMILIHNSWGTLYTILKLRPSETIFIDIHIYIKKNRKLFKYEMHTSIVLWYFILRKCAKYKVQFCTSVLILISALLLKHTSECIQFTVLLL